MAETYFDKLNKVSARKIPVLHFAVLQQIEAMRDAITADNATVVAAMTSASGQANLGAAQTALASAITAANTQAAARVAAINAELSKLKDALS